jgi:hypothetical protein
MALRKNLASRALGVPQRRERGGEAAVRMSYSEVAVKMFTIWQSLLRLFAKTSFTDVKNAGITHGGL